MFDLTDCIALIPFCSICLFHLHRNERATWIKPDGICKWMCFKVCKKEDPAQDDRPQMRSATISYWKKSISYFFNTTQKWNELSQTGNPTQSKRINQFIKVVKKQETRGVGAESQADRPLQEDELYQILDLFFCDDKHTAMMNFQHHMTARMDDVAQKDSLKVRLV